MTLAVGALRLTATPGGPVTVEILEDDFPTLYPFLGEPKEQRVTGELLGDDAYGQLTWIGIPSIDGQVDVEITTAGNKAARFQWSEDGGEEWVESGILVPLGGSVALGDTGFTAHFGASPPPEFETEYTFDEAGDADKSGAGPDVTITGSGSIDGVIQIQTGIGALRYRIDGGDWTSPILMPDLPVTIAELGVDLDIAPEDSLGLQLELFARFDFNVRGRFTLRLTRGSLVETYTRLRVGDPLWFVSSSVPSAKRSRLLSSASWVGTVRPPVGTYQLEP